MARPLRIEYPNAIYHVMARGNGKQTIFHIEDDYRRMVHGLSKTVGRTGWEVFAYVWMPNHIHLLRTPKPNLSKGMQYLLSGYANWYAKRHQRTGHLFQGGALRWCPALFGGHFLVLHPAFQVPGPMPPGYVEEGPWP